jgi:glycosyltransferase involved in cell wall biosynthesis
MALLICQQSPMEKISVSIIMPCLNEAKSIAVCISKAKIGLNKLKKSGIKGEIIIVDNGSSDGSLDIAQKTGVRVISEKHRGYGRAYKTGFHNARGNYIIIGDSDNTYDFQNAPDFINKLASGYDLVLGSRFNNMLTSTAMPFVNRYIGNPILTHMINIFYRCKISDTQTGFRAITKKAYQQMHLSSNGMEFASEMIIKAISNHLKISEIPINYSPRIGISKLSPISDAWRHIQAILIYSPTYAIILPGTVSLILGLSGTFLLLPGPLHVGKIFFDVHSLIVSILLTSIGTNIILIGLFAKIYSIRELRLTGGPLTNFFIRLITLNRLMLVGFILLISAFGIIGSVTIHWILVGFSTLSQERIFIVALGLATIGVQFFYSSFLFGLIQRKK